MGDFSMKLRAGKTICSDCSSCFWSEQNERRIITPGELLEGAMEHSFTAGTQRTKALSTQGRRGELKGGKQRLGAQTTVQMHSELLKLPLGVKIHVKPSSKAVFSRGMLGEKLPHSSCFFDLGDPYCRRLGTEYSSLHDPYLQEYHHRKHNFCLLKRGGFITRDGHVVCTLKEFNQYRQYLTAHGLEEEKMKRRAKAGAEPGPECSCSTRSCEHSSRQERNTTCSTFQEQLQQQLPKARNVRKAPGSSDSSCLREQRRKPSCPPTAEGIRHSVRTRRVKAAFDKAKTNSQPQQGQEDARLPGSGTGAADSQKKPYMAADSQCTAASERDAIKPEIRASAWRRYQEKAKQQLPTSLQASLERLAGDADNAC